MWWEPDPKLGRVALRPNNPAMSPLLSLGLALGVAFLLGRLCARVSVPRVTGYLLAGVILGPHALAKMSADVPAPLAMFALPADTIEVFGPLKDLAQAMILFAIGMSFRADRLKRLGRAGLALSGIEIGLTAVLVFALVAMVGVINGQSDVGLAAVLATIAVATAPAATLLVLRELESDGATTRHVKALVGLDNVASLLLFAIVFGGFYAGRPLASLGALGLGALVGIGAGLVLSVLLLRMATPRAFLVMGLAVILGTWGLALAAGGDPLLACLLLGATLANASPHSEAVAEQLRRIDYPIYVIFFLLAGADLHLGLLLGLETIPGLSAGFVLALALAYIGGRTLAKVVSAPLVERFAPGKLKASRQTGLALLAQAGLAIALVESANRAGVLDPSIAAAAVTIQAVVLAAVAFFEIIGPPAVRYAVVHAGEVKIVNLLPDQVMEGLRESVLDTLERLRSSLGIPHLSGPRDASSFRAVDIMRRHFTPIRADMPFEELLQTFASESYDQYPVVDSEGRFMGVISFSEIRSILVDSDVSDIIVAADLITGAGYTCAPETTLPEIIDIFEECHGEFSHLPVVEKEATRRVVGMIDQRGAMVWYRRHEGLTGGEEDVAEESQRPTIG